MSYTTMLFQRVRGVISHGQVASGSPAAGLIPIASSSASTDSPAWGGILDLTTAETDDTLVLAPDGAGGVEFRAESGGGGGGSSDFDIAGSTYSFPAGGGYDTLAQEDTGDGSSGYLQMAGGYLNIEGDDPSGSYAFGTFDGTSPVIDLRADNNAGVVTEIEMDASGNGDINISATEAVIVNISGSSGPSRFFVNGGNGIVFPSLAADPASPVAGQTYFNTGSTKLRCYDGSTWQNLW